jgi:hypothetical protein
MLTPAVSHPLQRTTSQVQRIDNGTLGLDADCLIGVLRLLLPEQVSLLRGVCWWWNDVACANYLWKRFYRLDFSPTLSRYVRSNSAFFLLWLLTSISGVE